MQLGVRLAAVLLALTSIKPVARAATVLREFTLVDGTGRDPVPGSTLVGLVRDVVQHIKFYTRESVEQQVRICAGYGVTAVQVLAKGYKPRAFVHIFYREIAKTFVSQGVGSPATWISRT
jgi:hypothetical protein